MTNLSEHHQYLLLGKVTGTLSADEEMELAALFDESEEFRSAYSELIAGLPQRYVESSFSHLQKPGYWEDLLNRHEKKGVRNLWQKIAIAAVIAGLIFGSWLLFNSPKKQSASAYAYKAPSSVVALKLSNGKIIDLSNQKGIIKEGSAALLNEDGSLTYTTNGQEGDAINEVIVPAGMDYKIKLSDGSLIWLNSATHLEFPVSFSRGTREVKISGEAYLEVAKNTSQPFIVHLPNSVVHVLGTEFNVNAYDSLSTIVALVSGSVNFTGGDHSVKLLPGKEGAYNSAGQLTESVFDPRIVLSWRKGLFYFQDANLAEISKVVERWFAVKTVIDNRAIVDMKFAGQLDKNQPLASFLDDLKAISKIESRFDKDGVLHFR